MIEYGLGGGSEQLRARTGGRFQQLVTRPDPIHAAPRHREQVRPGRGKSRVDFERERETRRASRGDETNEVVLQIIGRNLLPDFSH
jgi:hypothetical protein